MTKVRYLMPDLSAWGRQIKAANALAAQVRYGLTERGASDPQLWDSLATLVDQYSATLSHPALPADVR